MSTSDDQEPVTALAVSIERAAAMAGGVTSRHFRKQLDIEGGPIRTVRMGNRVLIPVDELRDYFKANVAMPTPAPEEKKREKKPRAHAAAKNKRPAHAGDAAEQGPTRNR
ncbi:MAG: hypothetical protein ABSG77_16325 [Candidatus Acidiferrum sp.]|jgi:hypothetical protein